MTLSPGQATGDFSLYGQTKKTALKRSGSPFRCRCQVAAVSMAGRISGKITAILPKSAVCIATEMLAGRRPAMAAGLATMASQDLAPHDRPVEG